MFTTHEFFCFRVFVAKPGIVADWACFVKNGVRLGLASAYSFSRKLLFYMALPSELAIIDF